MNDLDKLKYLLRRFGPIIALDMGFKSHTTIYHWIWKKKIPIQRLEAVKSVLKKYKKALSEMGAQHE